MKNSRNSGFPFDIPAAGLPTPSGQNSLAEILSQPRCWRTSLDGLQESLRLQQIRSEYGAVAEWLFVGCGSSYYIALSAAAIMTRDGVGVRALAVPASELLLYPELTLGSAKNAVAVLISRSGQTSEVVQAAKLLRARGVKTVAITCATGQLLEQLAGSTVILPDADEKSTVMTRSFTSMLLGLHAIIATLAGDSTFENHAVQLCIDAQRLLDELPATISDFVNAHSFSDYVYMGQGPFYGLACEGALKITEMSVSYSQPFHTLEFRHGPKSIVAKDTLLVFFLSERGRNAETDVLEEMKSLGATTLVVANQADDRIAAASDLLITVQMASPESYRLAPYLFAAQLLGLYTGIKKGYNPDSPRNLDRVVILDHETSGREPEHASL